MYKGSMLPAILPTYLHTLFFVWFNVIAFIVNKVQETFASLIPIYIQKYSIQKKRKQILLSYRSNVWCNVGVLFLLGTFNSLEGVCTMHDTEALTETQVGPP